MPSLPVRPTEELPSEGGSICPSAKARQGLNWAGVEIKSVPVPIQACSRPVRCAFPQHADNSGMQSLILVLSAASYFSLCSCLQSDLDVLEDYGPNQSLKFYEQSKSNTFLPQFPIQIRS